jgi:integrase
VAGVFKRKSDKDRKGSGKWTCWWIDREGKVRQKAGTTDRIASLEIARRRESEEKRVREGTLDPRELVAQEASRKSIEAHIDDYRLELVAKGDGAKHCNHIAGTLRRLMADAEIPSVGAITSDRIRAALGRIVAGGKSARTGNHAQAAARAFTRWLMLSNRLKDDPLKAMVTRYSEDADIRYGRRDLSADEIRRLLEAAEKGEPHVARRPAKSKHLDVMIDGLDRAMAYRIAMGTGFRASEVASLTAASFDLGDEPTVTVQAAYSKNRKTAVQPIRRDLAEALRPWLAGKPADGPVLILPEKTAKMIRVDLDAAGIPSAVKITYRVVDGKRHRYVDGVVDFHALRASYITHLIESGANPKTVQDLARHSSITLTIGRYTKTDDRRKREALEGPADDSHD